MTTDRIARVNELLRREIGALLFRLVNETGFDIAAVTVTQVITSPNLRTARVRISIRDHQAERSQMLNTIRTHRQEFQREINRNLVLKYTPRLFFELDTSLEKGNHILDVLYKLESEEHPPAEEDSEGKAPPS